MNGDDDGAPSLDLVDLLDRLQQPPEPAPVSMMPQTWGWGVLAGLLVVVALWVGWRAWRRWRENAYRRAALAELSRAGDDPAAIARLLRRTALAAWPRTEVASLTGEAWLRFLSRTGRRSFTWEDGRLLATAPYAPGSEPAPRLRQKAEDWIRHHKVGAGR